LLLASDCLVHFVVDARFYAYSVSVLAAVTKSCRVFSRIAIIVFHLTHLFVY